MRPVQFRVTQGDESLTSHAGLALIGAVVGRTQLAARVDQIRFDDRPQPDIAHSEIITTMTGLLSLGEPDFEAVEEFRQDRFFLQALGLRRTPSAATLRQRLDALADRCEALIREESADMVARHAPQLSPCFEVKDQRYGPWIPLDADVSLFDNSHTAKEGVSWTYRKVEGYAPIFAYLGEEGYLINAQLRQGKQHSQDGAPAFFKETLALARRVTQEKLLVRLDAAHDDIANIRLFQSAPKVDFIIKRNLRQESKDEWLREAEELGTCETPREGKQVYVGDTLKERDGTLLRAVFKVTRRSITAQGQALLIPEVEVETWWTSLEATPEQVIELYHGHGTSEQFHSELKTDMDLERLPSGKFATNSLILLLGMLAYNALRLCGQTALREDRDQPPQQRIMAKKGKRRRLRSVILDLMYQAARVVRHARTLSLSFGCRNPWFEVWRRTYGCHCLG